MKAAFHQRGFTLLFGGCRRPAAGESAAHYHEGVRRVLGEAERDMAGTDRADGT